MLRTTTSGTHDAKSHTEPFTVASVREYSAGMCPPPVGPPMSRARPIPDHAIVWHDAANASQDRYGHANANDSAV